MWSFFQKTKEKHLTANRKATCYFKVIYENNSELEEEVLEEGNVVNFWQNALSSLDDVDVNDDDSDEIIFGSDDDDDSAANSMNLLPSFYDVKMSFEFNHSPAVLNAISSPLPQENIPNYPQEVISKLKNFRAAKFPLQYLFNGLELFPLIQYEL